MPSPEATLIRLHAEHATGVYRFAWSVTKDESLAQEVVQELFLKLARDPSIIASAHSERAVIFTLTRNLALDALRRHARQAKAMEHFANELPEWFLPAGHANADDTRLLLTSTLANLPEDQRSVIHLHVWEELSFREIGDLLGTPTQTIASRYRYGLEKLRAALLKLEPSLA